MQTAPSKARSRKPKLQPAPAPPLQEARSAAQSTLWISLGLIAGVVFVFAHVRHFAFVNWDDPQYVTDNAQVLKGLSGQNIRWAFTTTGAAAFWLPLTWLSLMLDTTVWGTNAGGFHVTNVVFHAANV